MTIARTPIAALCFAALVTLPSCGRPPAPKHAGEPAHAEHGDDHAEEIVRLTPDQLARAGVVVEPLRGGEIATYLTLPAEVALNADAVLHVTPRAPGIVTRVDGFLGAKVKPGDPLATLESPDLGEAKIALLQAAQARAIADADLDRQRTITESTAELLEVLRGEPELDALRRAAAPLRIGENKGRLISAYARVRASKANYDRERELRGRGLSTESDLLAAQEAFNSSQADYLAAVEDIEFTYRLRLQEAERTALVAASEVENATRRLHLLGLSDAQIAGIERESDDDIARYELRAPAAGQIVAKHITPGEKVGADEPVYTLADLSTVWLNVSVYAEYLPLIEEGRAVQVAAGDREASGVIEYVSPVFAESTRTVTARVVLDNADGRWKPGELVTARVEVDRTSAERVVPIEALQQHEGRDVVFVQTDEGVAPVAVRLGRRGADTVEILGADVPLGAPIVVRNSFLMKAELGKGAAGHDH